MLIKPMRQLRFPLDMCEFESIPGAIARGVREHVLVRNQIVLTEAGASIPPGHAQIADADEIARIAHVIRCDPERMIANAGTRKRTEAGRQEGAVSFGDFRIPRRHLELTRRRISPCGLTVSGYHRLQWLNLLLPYCTDTLEPLVSACGHCGCDLGWRFARGIGVCETCREVVPSSGEPHLPDELAAAYRRFAELFALDRSGAANRADLPASLQSTSPDTLLRLAIKLGAMCQGLEEVAYDDVVSEYPPAVLAGVVGRGADLLRSWPHGLRDWADDQRVQLRHDDVAQARLRERLRRFVQRARHHSEFIEAMRDALPDLQKKSVRWFPEGRYYLYRETMRRLGLVPRQMPLLRKWPDLHTKGGLRTHRIQAQFDADQIDHLADVLRACTPLNSLPGRFGLPNYAIEELCSSEMLEWEDHAAVLLIRDWRCVRSASADDLEKNLLAARSLSDRPTAAVPLSIAVKRFGGRLKPWTAIVKALVCREVPYWIEGTEISPSRMFVLHDHVGRLESARRQEPAMPGFVEDDLVTQAEAAEILNVVAKEMIGLAGTLSIPFVKRGRALVAERAVVLSHAARIAWRAEIACHLGIRVSEVDSRLSSRGILRGAVGWSRPLLIDEGILPRP